MLQLLPYQLTSNKLATTCNLFAVAAVAFNISLSCTTNGPVRSSTVVFADTALTLYKLKTAEELSVIVKVIVSAFPLSSETRIDLTIVVVAAGAV